MRQGPHKILKMNSLRNMERGKNVWQLQRKLHSWPELFQSTTCLLISVSGKTAQLQRENHNQPLVFSTTTHKAKYNKKSCFVQIADETFGEIEYFLSHHEETFAMLNVFPPPTIDQDAHMYYCKRETACRNLMRLSSLGKPLFTALQGDVIYFLSVPIRESPEWLNSHIACQ